MPMASALKSLLFFLQRTAVMIMITRVTTAMGASTAAIIHRLLGGFLTTAEIKNNSLTRSPDDRPVLTVGVLQLTQATVSPPTRVRAVC